MPEREKIGPQGFSANDEILKRRQHLLHLAFGRYGFHDTLRRRWKEAHEHRLGACPLGCRGDTVGFDVDRLPVCPESIETGGLAGRFPPTKHFGQITQTISVAGKLAFPGLGRPEIRKGQPEVGAKAEDLVIDPAIDGIDPRGRCSHIETATSGERQRLGDQEHVFRDSDDRLAVIRQSRVRPSTGVQDLRAGNIDCRADSLDARALDREPRKHLRFRQGQRLSTGANRQQRAGKHGACNKHAHNTSNRKKKRAGGA
jgi:hypothetical protein